MQWLAKDGVVFSYRHLKPCREAGFRCFCSCNLSLKMNFQRENGLFDQGFTDPALEDTGLGYRLEKKGLRVIYNPGAVGDHPKFMSSADAYRHTELVAAALRGLNTKEAGKYLAPVEALHSRALAFRVKQLVWKPIIPFFGFLRPLLHT